MASRFEAALDRQPLRREGIDPALPSSKELAYRNAGKSAQAHDGLCKADTAFDNFPHSTTFADPESTRIPHASALYPPVTYP